MSAKAGSGSKRVALSALTGEGVGTLLEAIEARLNAGQRTIELGVAPSDGASLAWLYRNGEVIARQDGEALIVLTMRLDPDILARALSRPGITRVPATTTERAAE